MNSFNWNPEFTVEQVTGGKIKMVQFSGCIPWGVLEPLPQEQEWMQRIFQMSTAGSAQVREELLAPSTEALLHSEDLQEGPEVVKIFMACCPKENTAPCSTGRVLDLTLVHLSHLICCDIIM